MPEGSEAAAQHGAAQVFLRSSAAALKEEEEGIRIPEGGEGTEGWENDCWD